MQTLCLHVLCFYQLLLLQKPRVASLSCINKNIRRVEPVIGNVVEHFNLLSANPTKWPNTLKQFVGKLPTNCLSVFGHFVNLVLKDLIHLVMECHLNSAQDLCFTFWPKSNWKKTSHAITMNVLMERVQWMVLGE